MGERKTMMVELPDVSRKRLSLADLHLWMSLRGHYFVFDEDPSGHDLDPGILWQLGDVELDLGNLDFSMLCFHTAHNSGDIVHRAWNTWYYRDFEVVTEFSQEDKEMFLKHLGFIPEGWQRKGYGR